MTFISTYLSLKDKTVPGGEAVLVLCSSAQGKAPALLAREQMLWQDAGISHVM